MTRRVISKDEFLDFYENNELFEILVTPIAILAKTKPHKNYKTELVMVNIP